MPSPPHPKRPFAAAPTLQSENFSYSALLGNLGARSPLSKEKKGPLPSCGTQERTALRKNSVVTQDHDITNRENPLSAALARFWRADGQRIRSVWNLSRMAAEYQVAWAEA